jgi:tetratricopeptide (TPR) repeat protein
MDSLVNLSNKLYNKGLSGVKRRNLTEAILSLTESLRIDKDNTEARNLLGLTYLELGLVGDAVKHWIISVNLKRQNNPAQDYLNDIQLNSVEYDRLNEALRLYNSAIEYVECENDDMAIIQLKKAIELSPNFVNALNLLAFCHLIQKNSRAALMLIERVVAIDEKNDTALRYFRTITGTRLKAAAVNSSKTALSGKESGAHSFEPPFVEARTVKTENSKRATLFNDILFFSLGAIIAFAVMYVLVMPSLVQSGNERAAELIDEINTLNDKYAADTLILSGQIDDLKEEAKVLEETISSQAEQLSQFSSIQTVTSAKWLLDSGNVIGAAEVIYTVDLSELPVDVLEQAEAIRSATFSLAAQSLYNDGVAAYTASDFNAARDFLSGALKFALILDANLDNIYYYLGSAEKELSNIDAAKAHFSTIVEQFSESPRFAKAYEELQEM